MDRKVFVAIVFETYYSFSSLCHSECRPRRYAIIADKFGWFLTLVNLLLKWLDIDFIKVDLIASCLILVCADKVSVKFQSVAGDLL